MRSLATAFALAFAAASACAVASSQNGTPVAVAGAPGLAAGMTLARIAAGALPAAVEDAVAEAPAGCAGPRCRADADA